MVILYSAIFRFNCVFLPIILLNNHLYITTHNNFYVVAISPLNYRLDYDVKEIDNCLG